MKILGWALIFFCSVSQAQSVCSKKCAVKKPIHLHLYSKDMAQSWTSFNMCFGAINYWKGPRFSKLEYRDAEVGSTKDIRKALIDAANQCLEVKELRICGHSTAGEMILTPDLRASHPETRLTSATAVDDFSGLDCVMAKDAKINLVACQLGRGCEGQNFLSLTAAKLLPKGGKIEADRGFTVTTRIQLFTDVKTSPITAVASGNRKTPIRFHDRFGNQATEISCRDDAKKTSNEARQLAEKYKSCVPSNQISSNIKDGIVECRNDLTRISEDLNASANKYEKTLSRIQTGTATQPEMVEFARRSSEYAFIKSHCSFASSLSAVGIWCKSQSTSFKTNGRKGSR